MSVKRLFTLKLKKIPALTGLQMFSHERQAGYWALTRTSSEYIVTHLNGLNGLKGLKGLKCLYHLKGIKGLGGISKGANTSPQPQQTNKQTSKQLNPPDQSSNFDKIKVKGFWNFFMLILLQIISMDSISCYLMENFQFLWI